MRSETKICVVGLVAVFLIWMASAFLATPANSQSDPKIVNTRVLVLELDDAKLISDAMQVDAREVARVSTVLQNARKLGVSPQVITFAIEELILGPNIDHEGDTFYIVRVSLNGVSFYTIAWPNFNSTLEVGLDV